MHPLKEFFTELRRIELKEAYIIIKVNISPTLYEFLQKLEGVKFVDGQYHKYSGEIKVVLNNFINYWSEVINECVKEAYNLIQTVDRTGLLALIQETADLQVLKQNEYLEIFGTPANNEERNILDDIKHQLDKTLDDLQQMRKEVQRFDRQDLVTDFLKAQLDISLTKKNSAFEMLHTWLSNRMANYTYRIRASFEEILNRVSRNLKEMNEKRAEQLNNLMEELYEANKDRLMVSRQDRHRTSDTAEVEYVIKGIRNKIERHNKESPLANLEEEFAYWKKITADFTNLENTIKKIDTELEHVTQYLEQYNKMSTTEYPGSKKTCWNNMGENYTRRKEYLEKASLEARKALMTFFAVQGQNRIYYKDDVGTYIIDEYGHQIYCFNYGQNVYHLTCDRKFVEVYDTDRYYYDEVGRYILGDDGKKIYQRAPCCSTYNLNDDGLLVKNTKDCGHSEAPNPKCGLTIKNPNVFEMLPAAEPVNIKQTLTPEVADYLWKSVACILPEALCDTGIKQSINPIYCLANRLIHHKYHKNNVPQLKKKVKEAIKFKADVLQKRKDRAVAEATAYKAKQVKPRKPEESDDTQMHQVLKEHEAKEHLKNQLTYYEHY